MNRLKKIARSTGEKRTYTITAEPEMLDKLEQLLKDMESLGKMGSSQSISLFIDGDGAFWMDVKKKDGELSQGTNSVEEDEEIKYDFE